MQKLGRNRGRYEGEAIDVSALLTEILGSARVQGWQVEQLLARGGDPIIACHRLPADGTRDAGYPPRRIYLSAGIHGDEPAGPLALSRLLGRRLLPPDAELWLAPCLNPTGLRLNRRENADGVDLNRDYRQPRSDEVRAHVAWLERQPRFDLALCLHEDWEAAGFYVYELNPAQQPPLAERIVAAVAPVCPIEHAAVIDSREASGGIIRPAINLADRPDWPEAFHLITHKTLHSCTLEAPSDFALETRAEALCRGVLAAVQAVA